MHVLLPDSVCLCVCTVHVCECVLYLCLCVCALYVHKADITQSIAECAPLWQRKRSHNQPVDDSTSAPPPSLLFPPRVLLLRFVAF